MEMKRLYLSEFEFHDGEKNIKFNIVDVCTITYQITVAITDQGKISVRTFDLLTENKRQYFEYGRMLEQIDIDDFGQVDDSKN